MPVGVQPNSTFLPWLSSAGQTDEAGPATTSEDDTSEEMEDYVQNYACSLMFFGMLIKYYEDAIKEGDANREKKFWKIFMLIFKARVNRQSNRVKYAFESFKYLALVKAVLPPQLALKLKWGRFVNSKGGANNMECDRRLESEVRSVKDKMDAMGKNLTPVSAPRIARSSNNTTAMLKHFDQHCEVHPQVLSHSKMSRELDLQIMVNDLLCQDVFTFIPGRRHSALPSHNRSPVQDLSASALLNWMKTLVRKFARGNLSFLANED